MKVSAKLHVPGIEPLFLGCQARRLVTAQTNLFSVAPRGFGV